MLLTASFFNNIWKNLRSRNNCHLFLFNPGTLATSFTKEIQFGTAYFTCFTQDNGLNIRRGKRESSLHSHAVRYFPYGKALCKASALPFNHISTKTLDTFFATFYDLIINGYVITRFKGWNFFTLG